jgi:hypothetical protein
MDGCHIAMRVPLAQQKNYFNRKNFISTNVLLCCNFDLMITYCLAGVEGSTHDSAVLDYAKERSFLIPNNCVLLADAGYALDYNRVLTPYRSSNFR